ncbi:MAG: spermidine/putrescine-binding protein [Verrucomicrobiales bacterium]|jgi:spermidine/putrescine-binding protein
MKHAKLVALGFLIFCASACVRSADPGASTPASSGEVHVLTWEEYLPESTVEKFERATGFKLVQHYFENSDDQIGLMTAHPHHYDVAVISHSDLPNFTSGSLIRRLDPHQLIGQEKVGKRFRSMPNDPGNVYALPYLWGGLAVAYRKDLITNPELSLGLFFNDATPGKRLLVDEAADLIAMVNIFMGKAIDDYSSATLALAARTISNVAGSSEIELQPSSTMIESLSNGEFVVAVTYSGDIAQAAEKNPNIGYFLPKEGTPLWLDMLTVSRDSKNPAGAYAFLNFLLQPENIAEVSNELWYPNGIPESYSMISEELRADHALFPPDDFVARSEWCTIPDSQEHTRLAKLLRKLQKSKKLATPVQTAASDPR